MKKIIIPVSSILLGIFLSVSSFTTKAKQDNYFHYFVFHGTCVDQYLDPVQWEKVNWPPIVCEGYIIPCTIVTASDLIYDSNSLVEEIASWGGRTLQIPSIIVLSYQDDYE